MAKKREGTFNIAFIKDHRMEFVQEYYGHAFEDAMAACKKLAAKTPGKLYYVVQDRASVIAHQPKPKLTTVTFA